MPSHLIILSLKFLNLCYHIFVHSKEKGFKIKTESLISGNLYCHSNEVKKYTTYLKNHAALYLGRFRLKLV